jgi:DNA-binding MarR family transcriptional regulator
MTVDDRSLDQDVDTLWSLLFTIVLDGEKRLAAYLIAHGLTPPQLYVLKTLAERGGRCPIGEIARAHHLTHATMTGLVNRLEAMQPALVERQQRVSDRRSVDVVLTAAGQALFQAVQAGLMEQVRVMVSLLPAQERQDLIGYLSRYLTLVQAQFPISSS